MSWTEVLATLVLHILLPWFTYISVAVVIIVIGKSIRAHEVASGVTGSHSFDGPVGMDFRVRHWVMVTHLGVFDSGSDGLR